MSEIIIEELNYGSILTILGTLLLLYIIYWLFFIPCNWKKHIDDVGYDSVLKQQAQSNANGKKDAINRMRRLRKVGVNQLPPPYPNGWYSLMESSDLKAGQAKSVACLGEQFVVYRTLENKVYVLDAYCPHMGANVGIGGKVVGDSIECPFHLWRFRGQDGMCVDVPYSTCTPKNSKLRKWISKEINDFIFVWYHVEADSEPWELPCVEEIETKQFVYSGRNEYYVNCHIQEIPENGADLAHFSAVHNASLLAGASDPNCSTLANVGNHQWEAVWNASEAPTKHLAYVTLKHSIQLTPKLHVLRMDVKGQQIGPSYVQLHMKSESFGRMEVLQTVTPIEPLVQKVVHRFYAPRILAPLMKLAVFGESIMFERDMAMWNHKMFRNNPQMVKEDSLLKSFRKWYTQFYTENSKTFAECRDNMEW